MGDAARGALPAVLSGISRFSTMDAPVPSIGAGGNAPAERLFRRRAWSTAIGAFQGGIVNA
jgi:hypothetical protein